MKALVVAAIAAAWVLSVPGAVLAKGSGGGHGSGGHGGGHASGGHGGGRAAGGPSGGHTGGGQRASGGNRGGQSTPGTAQPRGSSSGSSATPMGHSRGTRPAIGTAVPRTASSVGTPQFFLPSRITTWPYAFGYYRSGLRFYDPFWSTFGYYAYSYDYGYGYSPDPFASEGPTGAIRLKVKPSDAAVYVDGYYAGMVDDFDGHFQHLNLTPGPHHIEVRAAGYETLAFDVEIQAHHTTEYRGTLQHVVP